MRSLYRHITLGTAVLAVLFLSIAVLPAIAQDNGPSLKNAIEMAQKNGIPQPDIDNLVQRARKKNIPDSQIADMLQPAAKLASQGLPYDLVMQKSLEGMAKGVQPSIITKVENELQSNTLTASEMTDEWIKRPAIQSMLTKSGESGQGKTFRNKILTTIAGVLFQGIPQKQLGNLLSDLSQSNVAAKMNASQVPVAIRILPDLSTSRSHPDVSRALIVQAIKGHFTADQIQQLPMAMERAQQMNQLPAEALAHGIGKQINDGVPAMTILQGLFEGHFPGGPSNGVPPGLNNPHSHSGKGPGTGGNHGNNGGGNGGNGNGNNGNGNGSGNGHGNNGNHG